MVHLGGYRVYNEDVGGREVNFWFARQERNVRFQQIQISGGQSLGQSTRGYLRRSTYNGCTPDCTGETSTGGLVSI